MEIVIPGLILVALMIYASTRIKRSAAAAFEAEAVENGDFSIQKPEGFLNVIGGDPRFAFEAYSKDFGKEADRFRLATATVTVSHGSVDDAVAAIEDEIVSDVSEVIAEQHYRVIEAARKVDGGDLHIYYKVGETGGKTYTLEIDVLAEADRDWMRKADAMLASFEIK